MKKNTWRKQHKFWGIALSFFVVMFAASGIILNHRGTFAKVNVGRQLLPAYQFSKWNLGLLRGTLPIDSARTLIYGSAGMWLNNGDSTTDFNQGLPEYADFRLVRNVALMPDSTLFAAAQYGLYSRHAKDDEWCEVDALRLNGERLSDVASLGDSLIVVSRDRIYLSLPPYKSFSPLEMPPGSDYDGKVSLFRVMMLLHSGQMFGTPGKLFLDLIGVIFIILCISGLVRWLLPKTAFSFKQKVMRINFSIHNKVGVYAIIVLLLVTISGWMLRPPLLIPLALNKMKGISGTEIDPNRAWHDKLRTLRYDTQFGDWLLSTSDGFYVLPHNLKGVAQALDRAPHVSVMGVNVMQKNAEGEWLVGSLSGMWKWNRQTGRCIDYFTSEPMPEKAGPPFGAMPVAGYSADFAQLIVADYDEGTDALPQPDDLRNLPMSLWQLALEIHTGRIYNLFGLAPLIWIFLAGAVVIWLLVSGWKMRRK